MREQSQKHSLMAALISGLIRIVFLPVWLVVAILYETDVILSFRKLGVSATALWPMATRWVLHQLGSRRDEACAKLIKGIAERLLHRVACDGVSSAARPSVDRVHPENVRLVKAGFDPRKLTFFLWEGVTYYLSREAMEKTFRAVATSAPGSVVVFDYATDANIERYRKPLSILHKALLKAAREPQTFWISSEPPVKKNLAALMDGYGLSLGEQLDYGRETKRKRLLGGLATAVVK